MCDAHDHPHRAVPRAPGGAGVLQAPRGGRAVVGLDIELGYNHRGIEKLSESKDFEETDLPGRADLRHLLHLAPHRLRAGHRGRRRTSRCRSAPCTSAPLIGELERIHSHLLWLGLAGHFLGFNTVWMWAWRYREDVLNILELITGNRNHYAMMKPGGVRRDIQRDDMPAIAQMLDGLQGPLDLFRDAVVDDPLIHARTKGVGVLTREQAHRLRRPRADGARLRRRHRRAPRPSARRLRPGGLGRDRCGENGDVFDKAVVRILEMFESIRIIEQCLEQLKTVPGPIDSNPGG